MKLKRLEIIGFKSFVDRTVVDFEKDITGIVGPNGCGKSNIVDSIRWVMGEQSAKHLRGRQMEDVIFAGSTGRAPLSMASVELTFSTDGYQTPAQYLNHSEISICRRLYRTGESEYFINKVPVRLKDITELFLGTGIGTKAYSVIEQGRISQIVTAKPEDRRFYIEEVAGVTRFKSRKEAALRKMEATTQNLLRLNDVVEELERQLRSLSRQAKKAEKYKEVKEEFQKWDLALSSYEYFHADEQQTVLEKHLREFDEKETALKTQLHEHENSIEDARLQIIEKEKDLQIIQNNLFEVTNYVRLAENTLSHKNEEIDRNNKRLVDIQADIHRFENDLISLQEKLAEVNEQKLVADLEEEDLSENVAVRQQKVDRFHTSLSNIKKELDEERRDLNVTAQRLTQIETLRSAQQQKQADIQSDIVRDDQLLETYQTRYNQLSKIYREANDSLTSLKQLKLDLTTQTDEIATELERSRENLEEEEKVLADLREQLTIKQSRLASLEELQKNFEGYHEGPRSVLMKKGEIDQDGIFGTVADFVETDPEYEGAVSAVLGEKLQYVVVQSQQTGLQAMDYLRTESLGRSSFIPMQVRSYDEAPAEVPQGMGVLGPLHQFVNIKGDYQHLAQTLFGDVVLVENLEKALDLWSSNGHRKTLVTLGGEVVDPSGVITGGTLANTSKALLEKKREIKDLAAMVSRFKEEVFEKDRVRNDLLRKVKTLEVNLEEIKTSTFDEEIKIANHEKDISHFKIEMDSLQDKQKELQFQLGSQRDSLNQLKSTVSGQDIEECQLKVKKHVFDIVLQEREDQFNHIQSQYDSISQELIQQKIQLGQASQTKTHLDSEMKRLLNELTSERISLLDRHKSDLMIDDRNEFLENEITYIQKVLDKKLGQRETLEESLVAEREIYDAMSSQIREQEAVIKAFRHEHEQAGKKLNQVTVELTEIRSHMKHLSEQCLERHQIPLTEVYKNYYDETLDVHQARQLVDENKDKINRIGSVNTEALEEYEEMKARFDFLSKQKEDLQASLQSLERVIHKINRTTRDRFKTTFNLVNERFQQVFPKLFQGGQAKLVLTDENDLLTTGVEIIAQPPGKKCQSISLLSGGEKALTAVSLIFSIFQIKPSPFCILDEVDAPLDDVNVSRYNDTLRSMTHKTQFIVITHNKKTMEMVDVLYGVTMQEPGVSQLVSVALH